MDDNKREFFPDADRIFDLARKKSPEELVFTYKGMLFPTTVCAPEVFQALEEFEANKDDVMLVTYPKCGTNWVIKILEDIIYTFANKSPPPPDVPAIERAPLDHLENLKRKPSPKVLVTHLNYDHIPKSVFKNKTKKLFLLRNPKDTAVSYFHFSNKMPVFPSFSSWDEFFQHFMTGKVCWGSYFDFLLSWNNQLDDDVLIITYEDLKENLVEEVKKIAEFLEFPMTQEQIQGIAERSTFQNMSANYMEAKCEFVQILFRKAEIGDWKNLFSPAQSQEMDAKFEACLRGTKLGAKMKYDIHCQL